MSKGYGKFFARLLILAASFFIIDLLIGSVLHHFYFTQTSGYQYRLTYVIEHSKEDMLVLGSSRANHHYVPGIFQDSLKLSFYNAGIDGQFILFEDAVTRCILKRYSPKYMILDFSDDEFVFSETSYDRLSDLLPYYSDHSSEIESVINLRGRYEKIKLLSKMYPFNSVILSIAVGNLELNQARKEDQQGYVPLSGNIDYNVKLLEPKEEKTDTNKINAFKDVIIRCQNAGVKLFVVVSPYYQSINSGSLKLGAEICGNMNVPFLDFSSDELFVQKKELFKDAKHLNNTGAEIFSQKLAKDINSNLKK